jgi:hypothetical protein
VEVFSDSDTAESILMNFNMGQAPMQGKLPISGTFEQRLAHFETNFCCEKEDATERFSDGGLVYINKLMKFMSDCFYEQEIRTPFVRSLVWNVACKKILQRPN